MRVDIVLFDLDGTLVNTWDLYVEAYLRTLEEKQGRRPTFEELRALRPRSELGLFRDALGPEAGPRAHGLFLEIYRELHDELFAGIYPGVPEMLVEVRARSRAVGIVTGKSEGAWRITREMLGDALGDFDVVVTADTVEPPKPDPEGLLHALAAVEARADRAVYVGDSVGDAGAAAAAGTAFGAVLWAKDEPEVEDFLVRVRGEVEPVVLAEPADLPRWMAG